MENIKEIEKFIDGIPGRPKPKRHGSKFLAIALVLILVTSLSTIGAVLPYYGKITASIKIKQAVLLDGADYQIPIIEDLGEIFAGESLDGDPHTLENVGSKTVTVVFHVNGTPDLVGIEVTINGTPLEGYTKTLAGGESFDFTIHYEFGEDIVGDYTITTTIAKV